MCEESLFFEILDHWDLQDLAESPYTKRINPGTQDLVVVHI